MIQAPWQATRRPARPSSGFMLLEVMVAILIVGIAMVALLRSFIITMNQISGIRDQEIAMLLGKSFLDDLILEPPPDGRLEGTFGEDPRWGEYYENWHWSLRVENEEPDYDERPQGTLFQELEEIYYAELIIIKETDFGRREMLRLHTILMEPDIFSPDAIERNQMF